MPQQEGVFLRLRPGAVAPRSRSERSRPHAWLAADGFRRRCPCCRSRGAWRSRSPHRGRHSRSVPHFGSALAPVRASAWLEATPTTPSARAQRRGGRSRRYPLAATPTCRNHPAKREDAVLDFGFFEGRRRRRVQRPSFASSTAARSSIWASTSSRRGSSVASRLADSIALSRSSSETGTRPASKAALSWSSPSSRSWPRRAWRRLRSCPSSSAWTASSPSSEPAWLTAAPCAVAALSRAGRRKGRPAGRRAAAGRTGRSDGAALVDADHHALARSARKGAEWTLPDPLPCAGNVVNDR
jgi:hypothetical protein